MMNASTELRKLPPGSLRELVQILEYNDSWKILMDKIPKLLENENYECRLHRNNSRKYRSEHFRLIESASKTTGRACTEILFDEWGTSGRIRPALGHLLFLLTSVDLFRAADFVAVNLLNIDTPSRPTDGPPAPVTIPIIPDRQLEEVERILDSIDYPSSIISNLTNDYYDVNINRNTDDNVHIIPKIVVSEIYDQNLNADVLPPLVIDNSIENRRKRMSRQNASVGETVDVTTSVSDMIKFSQLSNVELSQNSVPNISDLMNSNSDNESKTSETLSAPTLPDLSALNIDSTIETLPKEETVPALSELLNDTVPHISDLLEESSETPPAVTSVPNLSIFNVEESNDQLPQMSALMSSQSVVPQFDILLSGSKPFIPIIDIRSDASSETTSLYSNGSSNISRNTNLSHTSQRTCVSPLPNLSLNTMLPHFTYYEIESATNCFDETPFNNCIELENLQLAGRFLGSGAFGSVFLALNIANKLVAVKKLVLNNTDVVNVDDPVTKQFRNEVEILSKYKHENLLSIIGYSCDGPTYCLLYEFMPGGALKDRLQCSENRLIWTDRMYIALGTARAVAYLHTAYSTPLIHRDIKSANILLDSNNKPKLCDFGLVKLITNQNTNTSTTAFGTSAYMAREAFRGDVSVKLDTFSFGVVLLELITGLPPLDENREGLDIVTHVEEVCEDESGIIPLIDVKAGSWVTTDKNFAQELYKISIKCLEENKKKRPTMVEVSETLAELIKDSA